MVNWISCDPVLVITFSKSADKFKRRSKNDEYLDFSQIDLGSSDNLLFFGGKDYQRLFVELTKGYKGRRIIFFNSSTAPNLPGCQLIRYETSTRTNWHYECIGKFLKNELAI